MREGKAYSSPKSSHSNQESWEAFPHLRTFGIGGLLNILSALKDRGACIWAAVVTVVIIESLISLEQIVRRHQS